MEKHNPNIPYDVIERYVSVFRASSASNLFTREDYDVSARLIDKMSGNMHSIMRKITTYDNLDAQIRRKTPHPLQALAEPERKVFLDELNALGVGNFSDLKSVYADKMYGGRGYKTPVYNVNNHPVMGLHFEDNGQLKDMQRAVYAPTSIKLPAPKR